MAMRQALHAPDELESVKWAPGDLCPACLSDVIPMDHGGAWCAVCATGRPLDIEVVQRRADVLRAAGRRLPNEEA